jgi:formamidopyrimidine-DNA glycosylase
MPELPEVHTTVTGIQNNVVGHKIIDAWSDYDSSYFRGKNDIRDKKYFNEFRKLVTNEKIISAERRAKNILIHLSNNKTILIHMKMTGHVLYGEYVFSKKSHANLGIDWKSPWKPIHPPSLRDPFNRHIHFVLILDKEMHVALSDSRKFAKVTLINTDTRYSSVHLRDIGPEPLEKEFTFKIFSERLSRMPNKPIKISLMDQKLIAGIGNIYADESLWRAKIHPSSITNKIPENILKELYKSIRTTLSKGIDFGGDSMSDYRNIHGEKGKFQEEHMVYQRKNELCKNKGCKGKIERIVVGGRGTHYCSDHQKLYK